MEENNKKEELLRMLRTVFCIEMYSKQAIDELLEQGRIIEVDKEDEDTVLCPETKKIYKFI